MAGCKVHICPEIYQQWAGRGYDKTLWERRVYIFESVLKRRNGRRHIKNPIETGSRGACNGYKWEDLYNLESPQLVLIHML